MSGAQPNIEINTTNLNNKDLADSALNAITEITKQMEGDY